MSTFPDMLFEVTHPSPTAHDTFIAPRAAAVAKTIGWCFVGDVAWLFYYVSESSEQAFYRYSSPYNRRLAS